MKCLVNFITSITLIIIIGYEPGLSQNLVQNGSFEIYHSCPNTHSQLDSAVGWNNPTQANPDYFHFCSGTNCHNCVPGNFNGFQAPNCGQAYIGLYAYHPPNSYRGYAQTKLTSPLVSGERYHVSFDVSLGDEHGTAITNLGVYFSKPAITRNDQLAFSQYQPQILNPDSIFLDEYVGWQTIQGIYTANGNEEFITIGNFLPDSLTNTKNNTPGLDPRSYYYIDNVKVYQVGNPDCENVIFDSLFICNGDSIFLEKEYRKVEGVYYDTVTNMGLCCREIYITDLEVKDWLEIDTVISLNLCTDDSLFIVGQWIKQPGTYLDTIDNRNICRYENTTYQVSEREWDWRYQFDTIRICNGDTLYLNGEMVSEPGVYIDTISEKENCKVIVQETHLEIIGGPFKSIPEITAGCRMGPAYVSATSPGTSYLWSNGSTDSVTRYNVSGVHWVTRRRGDCVQTDSFEVIIFNRSFFSIGADTSICAGDTMTLKTNLQGANFLWNTGEEGSQIKITKPGKYWAEWVNFFCYSIAEVEVGENTSCDVILILPNIITPNGDGKNDILEPVSINGIEELEIKIYNRWGNLVGSSNDLRIGWDPGDLPSGDYFYEVKYWGFVYQLGSKKGSFKILR